MDPLYLAILLAPVSPDYLYPAHVDADTRKKRVVQVGGEGPHPHVQVQNGDADQEELKNFQRWYEDEDSWTLTVICAGYLFCCGSPHGS